MLPAKIKDLFSGHAGDYAQFRPKYPEAFVKYISRLVKYRGVVWDCACGNGQLSLPLAEHFQLVLASDVSEKQVAAAPGHEGILYTVQPAEQTDFPDEFFDMVVVGQAIHWFNLEAFYKEANRVMGPNAVIAAIGYGLMRISPEVDAVLHHFYKNITGPYWEPERKYIDEAYQNLPFPFEPIDVPAFEMPCQWNFAQMMGYLNTWTVVKRYEQEKGVNPLSLVEKDLEQAWGGEGIRKVVFPLFVKAGRKINMI
ncbi:MAG: methyltransferase domain-containing protein [Chitinophagaceae bacterium]|nr:methyltransferase domain-containing protein [Chitinophagaceae bacterium]